MGSTSQTPNTNLVKKVNKSNSNLTVLFEGIKKDQILTGEVAIQCMSRMITGIIVYRGIQGAGWFTARAFLFL